MFRKRFARLFLAAAIAALLPACDVDRLNQFKPGVSTGEEVRKIMGQPNFEWKDADGTRIWEYPRTPEGIVNYMLVIGPDEVLREVRQVLTEDNFARVKAGMSQDEVYRLLGRPAHQQRFTLQQETVWDWKTRVEPGMTWFFNVHFDTAGVVTRTSTHFVARG